IARAFARVPRWPTPPTLFSSSRRIDREEYWQARTGVNRRIGQLTHVIRAPADRFAGVPDRAQVAGGSEQARESRTRNRDGELRETRIGSAHWERLAVDPELIGAPVCDAPTCQRTVSQHTTLAVRESRSLEPGEISERHVA